MKYYSDFPTIPIGGSNPYHKCLYCGRSVPEINGRLERHADWCEYRMAKELEISIAPLKEKAAKWDMIQWAIDEDIEFLRCPLCEKLCVIEKIDIERLEQLYKEREK